MRACARAVRKGFTSTRTPHQQGDFAGHAARRPPSGDGSAGSHNARQGHQHCQSTPKIDYFQVRCILVNNCFRCGIPDVRDRALIMNRQRQTFRFSRSRPQQRRSICSSQRLWARSLEDTGKGVALAANASLTSRCKGCAETHAVLALPLHTPRASDSTAGVQYSVLYFRDYGRKLPTQVASLRGLPQSDPSTDLPHAPFRPQHEPLPDGV